jgi:NADH-quinone oxidoreductase subunit L
MGNNQTIQALIVLISALPLAAAVLTAVLGPRWLRRWSHVPALVAIFVSFLCSLGLIQQIRSDDAGTVSVGFEEICTLWTWASVEDAYTQESDSSTTSGETTTQETHDFTIDVTLRADALTSAMLAMVTFVSFLVVFFAAGYMRDDPGYWRFFSYVALFVFSMTMLVSVSNLLLLYVFWEAVGVCSYLLIGFWYQKSSAAAAGKKAFLVNRVGDFGFALALLLIWSTYGTLNFHDTPAGPDSDASGYAASPTLDTDHELRGILGQTRLQDDDFAGGAVGTAICLLLLIGACGKSAQFPLHVWLPDAMEGPTPVSALIHAATMVTAGVYMVVRFSPLFLAAPAALVVVAAIGGFTALLAGLIALTQNDLKRVLAYSTISQLGFMFLAVGTGSLAGITAGMFHLLTHAFFKALLFLGAGSVMHAMGNVIDMRQFGGLRRLMPITHWTFLIGCLALSGIFPLAGFWSKDAVLGAVHDKIHELEHQQQESEFSAGQPSTAAVMLVSEASRPDATHQEPSPASFLKIYKLLYWVAVAAAFLTAFYTGRAYFMTFWGPLRIPQEAGNHAHESPFVMTIPLSVLALCRRWSVWLSWGWILSDHLRSNCRRIISLNI